MKLLFVFMFTGLSTFNQVKKDVLEKSWYNADKTAKIQIYKSVDGKYFGKIIWLSEPNENGKPKLDKNNSDASKKLTPILNLVILKSFVQNQKQQNIFENGTVYDPDSGKTYCGKLTLNGNQLKLKGYICNFSWLGRSEIWTSAE